MYECPDLSLYIAFPTNIGQYAPVHISSTWEGRKQSPEMPIKWSKLHKLSLEQGPLQLPFQGSTHYVFSKRLQSWGWWWCHKWLSSSPIPCKNNSPILWKCSSPSWRMSRNCETCSDIRFSEKSSVSPVYHHAIHPFSPKWPYIWWLPNKAFVANRAVKI